MRTLHFTSPTGPIHAEVTDLVIAGWTGRDAHKLQEHIDELAALGVAPPATVPCYYRAGLETLTQAPMVDVLGGDSSGEGEWVLIETPQRSARASCPCTARRRANSVTTKASASALLILP